MILDLYFSTEVRDIDVCDINEFLGVSKDFDINTISPTAYIDYKLQPETRKWGIKSISLIPVKIKAIIEWEVSTEEMTDEEIATFVKAGGKHYTYNTYNDTILGQIEIETNCLDGWEVKNETGFQIDGSLSIDNVSINLSDRTITLS